MALGADRRRITLMFLGEAIRLLVIGLAAGTVLALVATRAASLLYGLAPHDHSPSSWPEWSWPRSRWWRACFQPGARPLWIP